MKYMIGLCLFTLALAGCQDNQPVDTSAVDPLARAVLEGISEGKAEMIYNQHFAPLYRQQISLEEWKEMVADYRKLLGDFESLHRQESLDSTLPVEDAIEGQFTYNVVWEKTPGTMYLNLTRPRGADWQIVRVQLEPDAIIVPSTQSATATTLPAE